VAKNIGASTDALVDLFGRIEAFFKCIEAYNEVPPTVEMTDLMVKIVVEVIGILAVATREMKQGPASELFLGKMSRLINPSSERYLKKLAGRTDIEDALQRLDKLTHEEAMMATAQVLKFAHRVDDKITGVRRRMNEVIDGAQACVSWLLTHY
jgi:hypothetical protein